MILNKSMQKEFNEQLLEAAATGSALKVKQLLDKGAQVHARDEETHWTALHMACYFDVPKIVSLLIKRGALVDSKAVDGTTPLLIAAGLAGVEVAQLLLEGGAKVNAADSKGFTPLMLAADRPDFAMAELLMEYRANPALKSHNELTAIQIAHERGAPAIASHLESTMLASAIAPRPKAPARMM